MRWTQAAIQSIQRGSAQLLDFCFPRRCLLCEQEETLADTDSSLCLPCQQKLVVDSPQCARCAANVGPYVDASVDCVQCRGDRFAFEQVISLGIYQDELRTACLRAKLSSGQPLIRGLVESLETHRRPVLDRWRPDLIIPVPHHWWERLTRRHLSPLTMAEALAARLRCPVRFDLLAKCKSTEKQALLPRSRRWDNMRGAFRIAGGTQFSGASILLVDDVMTSGATAHECSRALKAAGAAHIYVAVLARAQVGR
ncbi:MAG: ComF family protein [Planctomycetota bacterium]|nr:MAG: ComF family protein [Planctomycetota bacterium]